MITTNRGGWKTCPRGHKYRGPDPCPVCWPGKERRRSNCGSVWPNVRVFLRHPGATISKQ